MSWLYLLLAGIAEVIYAVVIPKTDGFTKLGPSLFCAVFIAASIYLLSLSTRTIPIGTAYAVWVGLGASGTALYGMFLLGEEKGFLRIVCLALIVGGVVGLKMLGAQTKT